MKHLTDEQRKRIGELFEECDINEFLQCVAGLVSHNVFDLTAALAAATKIREASMLIAKSRGK